MRVAEERLDSSLAERVILFSGDFVEIDVAGMIALRDFPGPATISVGLALDLAG